MKNNVVSIVICLLLFSSSVGFSTAENTKTWYVDDDGTADYTRIQDAIDAAENGDIIFVYSGIYDENIGIDKSVTVQGEDLDQVIIDGYGGSAIIISASDVTLTGFTLKNGKPGTYADGLHLCNNSKNILVDDNKFIEWRNANGIFIDSNCEQSIISNNYFINCHHAIDIKSDMVCIKNNMMNTTEYWEWSIRVGQEADHVVIEQNTIYGDGITLSYTNGSTIKENTIINQRNARGEYYSACGVNVGSCENTTITFNNFYHNGIFIHGDTIESWTTHSIDGNKANDHPIYYFKNQVGSKFTSDLNAAQIILANCSSCVIENLELQQVSIGIQLGFSSDNIISHNQFVQTGTSIYVECSDSNLIEHNQIQDNSDKGIWLRSSDDTQIIDNMISNTYVGIFQQVYSSNTEIKNNVFSQNEYGINCVSSRSTTIERNAIQENENGIFLASCYEYIIQQNNFLENTVHAIDSGEDTYWNNDYWDDWIGLKIPVLAFMPYIIDGVFLTNFDWHPASEPIDIDGGDIL